MGAFDGIKVLEAGLLVQGPQAAALLGDWGADVVKIELPGFGDQSRWLPIAPGDGERRTSSAATGGSAASPSTSALPRVARRSSARRAGGRVHLELQVGHARRVGLSYEAVSARNPRLVYAAGTSFGTEGPGAGREGADLSAQAAGGLISTTGADGEPVSPVAVTICDHIASLNIAAGVSAALYARERTGRGQRIDVSLLGGQIWAQAVRAHRGRAVRRLGRPLEPRASAASPASTACSRRATVGSRWSVSPVPTGPASSISSSGPSSRRSSRDRCTTATPSASSSPHRGHDPHTQHPGLVRPAVRAPHPPCAGPHARRGRHRCRCVGQRLHDPRRRRPAVGGFGREVQRHTGTHW